MSSTKSSAAEELFLIRIVPLPSLARPTTPLLARVVPEVKLMLVVSGNV